MGLAVYAEGLYRSLKEVQKLDKPILISESGAAATSERNNKDDYLRKLWLKR